MPSRTVVAALFVITLGSSALVTTGLQAARAAGAPVVHGYAAVNGTTTGGAGGPTTRVTSASALVAAAKAPGPAVIEVQGTLGCSGTVRLSSDKTVLGVGADSGLTGCGLTLKGVSNVIVQNLRIAKVEGGDAIGVQKSDHIWIDHNDLSSDTTHGTDFYDGLLDLTHAVDFVTVSNNYFHDHVKCSLIGHSDDNGAEDTGHLRVTYDHNYFRNCDQRTPSIRFGTLHAYDNYFVGGSTGIHTRMNAQALVQNNVWSGTAVPIETTKDSDVDGFVNQSGNDFGGGTNLITRTGSFTTAPYPVTLDPISGLSSSVPANAGTGKL